MATDGVGQLVTAMDRAAQRFTRRPAVHDFEHTLSEIVAGAVAAVPGADHAGLTVLDRRGRLTSTAPTDEIVERLDQAQTSLGEGPCVLAVDIHTQGGPDAPAGRGNGSEVTVVRVDDMEAESSRGGRWPRFAPEALRHDVNSMISVVLVGDRREATALNLYAREPRVFDDEAEVVARLFADQAAIALYGARHAADLARSVATRDVIGQAKGILMERHGLDGDSAFAMLLRASQDTNIKLVDVARWLVSETSGSDRSGGGSDRQPGAVGG